MLISKPKYIRKYDFQRYFYRNKDEWFWPTTLITDYLKNLTKKELDYEEDEENDEEIDSYDFFNDQKQNNVDLDKNDPKIYEGNKIDKESKQFMKDKYLDCIAFDFDQHDQYKFNNESSYQKTIELLKENENIIIFQPTFLYDNKAIARPDGFVKRNNHFILIETKGTTTIKLVHLIDITYQALIINQTINKLFKNNIDEFKLCFIDYRFSEKNDIGFKFSEYACSSKSGFKFKMDDKKIDKYSDEYIEKTASYKDASVRGIKFSDLIYQKNFIPLIKNKKNGNIDSKWKDFFKNYEMMKNNFDLIIEELFNADIDLRPQFKPSEKYKSWIKNNDYWPNIRDYYLSRNDLFHFHYSGNLVPFKNAIKSYMNHDNYENFVNIISMTKPLKAWKRYLALIKKHNFALGGFDQSAISTFNMIKLHDKKVYFDFESINLATRVIDNTLPFMQTVNQVSVIFDHGDKRISESNNLVIDPLKMTLDSYKQIIDAIMPSTNLKLCDKYLYIVYNKGFEKSRLEEMKMLFNINHKTYATEYGLKIDIIINNIFDLADLFNLQKESAIAIEKNHGFYSIKKVLPIVEKYYPDIFKATKCLDYKTLEMIHNGTEAQKESTKRFFNIIDDNEWNKIANNLKIYCENDVRAMIAVEYMIGEIVKTK